VFVFVNLGKNSETIAYTGKAPEGNETTINFFEGKQEPFPTTLAPGEYKVFVNR
jgi:hypothetical protein